MSRHYQHHRFLSPEKQGTDDKNYQCRPMTFAEFIGHENQIEKLKVTIDAAKITGRLRHILLTGYPGNGKTTLSRIIANETGKRFIMTSGPELRQPYDLTKILNQVREGDILFIDEVHRIDIMVQEMMYSVMEDFKYNETDLPLFTIIGATTKQGTLTRPFNSRFNIFVLLREYSEKSIEKIMMNAAVKRNIGLTNDAAELLAHCARQTPRVAIRLIDNSLELAVVQYSPIIDYSIAKKMLGLHEIDENGLDPEDRNYLIFLANQYPNLVGLKTIALSLSGDKDYESTIEYVIEPWLLRLSLIRKTSRGRILTDKALHNDKLGLGKIVMDNLDCIPPPRDGGREGRYRGGNGGIIEDIDDDIDLAIDNNINKKRRGW